MKVYGNHCNAGTIYRELQPAHEPKALAPTKPLPVIAPPKPKAARPPREHKHKRHSGKAVICVETGQRFESITLAAEAVGLSAPSVRQASSPAYPNRKTAGGYHWRWA